MNGKLKEFLMNHLWKILVGLVGIIGAWYTMRTSLASTVKTVEQNSVAIVSLEKFDVAQSEINKSMDRNLTDINRKMDILIAGRRQ